MQQSREVVLRIKAATRDLVTECGGIVRAAKLLGLSDSQVSRLQVTDRPDLISIPQALILQADCGVPIVTQAMAALQGWTIDGARERDGHANVALAHAATVAATAALMAEVAQGSADGEITPSEAERIDRTAGALAGNVEALRGHCAKIKAGVR